LDAQLDILTWGYQTSYLFTEESVQKEHCLKAKENSQSTMHLHRINLSDIDNMTMSLVPNDNCDDGSISIVNSDERFLKTEVDQNLDNLDFQCSPDELFPDIQSTEKVEEQSKRISLKFLAQKFSDRKFPAMGFDEWIFLEISKDAFKTACPKYIIDPVFLDTIVSLFGHLLLESFKFFPPVVDARTTARVRIRGALELCFAKAKTFNFIKTSHECSPVSFHAMLIKTKIFAA